MYKSFVLLIVSISLMGSLLVGCGNKSTGEAAANQTKAHTSTAKTEEPQKEVELSLLAWQGIQKPDAVLPSFSQNHPNIKVNVEVQSRDQFENILKTRMVSGDAPDLFFYQGQVESIIRLGNVMDISSEPAVDFMKKEMPALAQQMSVGGKTYFIGTNSDVWIKPIYYNRKLLAQVGINEPKPNNIQEFYDICEKLKAAKIDPIVMGGKDKWPIAVFTEDLEGKNKATYFKEDNQYDLKLYQGDPKFTLKGIYKEQFDILENLVKKGYISKPSLSLTYEQAQQYFVDGKAAIFPNGAWLPGEKIIKAAVDKGFDYSCFVYPYDKTNGKVNILVTSDLLVGISSSTKNPVEAKQLLNYWGSAEGIKLWCEGNSGTTMYPDVKIQTDEHVINFYDEVKGSGNFEFVIQVPMAFPNLFDYSWNAAQNILAGSTVDAELKKIEDVYNKARPQTKKLLQDKYPDAAID